MLKIIAQLGIVLSGLVAQAQVTEQRGITEFTKLDVRGNVEIIISNSTIQSLTAEAASLEDLHNLKTTVDRGILIISSKPGAAAVRIHLTASNLKSIKASGSSKVILKDQLNAGSAALHFSEKSTFTGSIAASGKVKVIGKSGAIINLRTNTSQIDARLSGRARANFSGRSLQTWIDAESSAHCHARNLISSDVIVKAVGNSTVAVHSDDHIHIEAEENSEVTYYGKPARVHLPAEAVVREKSTAAMLLTQN